MMDLLMVNISDIADWQIAGSVESQKVTVSCIYCPVSNVKSLSLANHSNLVFFTEAQKFYTIGI